MFTMNHRVADFQQKRDTLMLNLKRQNRETLFKQNRKRIQNLNCQDHNQLIINSLITAIQENNKKIIKKSLKELIDIQQISIQQWALILKCLNQLLLINPQEDNSYVQNDCLILMINSTLEVEFNDFLFQSLPQIVLLINFYNNQSNQLASNAIIDKCLIFIGNLSCNDAFLQHINQQLITTLTNIIQYSVKKMVFQALWVLNNIMFLSHQNPVFNQQLIHQISDSSITTILIKYLTNSKDLDRNNKKFLYWYFYEISIHTKNEQFHFDISQEKELEFILIVLSIYSNISSLQIVPYYCDVNLVIKLYYELPQDNIRKEILVLLTNLVLITKIDPDLMRKLIFDSLQVYQIDSLYLLYNCLQNMQIEIFSQNDYNILFHILQNNLEIDQEIRNSLIKYFNINIV